MNTQVTFKKVEFTGVHYLDLIAKMISQGGNVSELVVDQNQEITNVTFSVNFNQGMTLIKETLVYNRNQLMLWKVQTSVDEKVIFSREELNYYLNI